MEISLKFFLLLHEACEPGRLLVEADTREIGIAATMLSTSRIGKPDDSFCGPKLDFETVTLLFIPAWISYSFSCFCAYKITKKIKKHSICVAFNSNMQSQIEDANEIVKLLILEVLVSMVFHTPSTIPHFVDRYVSIPLQAEGASVCVFYLPQVISPKVIVLLSNITEMR